MRPALHRPYATRPATPAGEPEPFSCLVERGGGGVVSVLPAGELDLQSLPSFTRALARARASEPVTLVLDLRDVTFIDCATLRVLLGLMGWARAADVQFSLVPGPPTVQRLMELTGVADMLPFTPAMPSERDAAA